MPFAGPIWAEVDLAAITENVKNIRKIVNPHSMVMAVVKANGYGHGALEVARVALKNGADFLAVARLAEAQELRHQGIQCPILILGFTPEEQYEALIKENITQTVYSLEMATRLSEVAKKLNQKVKIHVKIDSGMGRIGFLPDNKGLTDIETLSKLDYLDCEGIFTHFANSDARDKTYTEKQFNLFMSTLEKLSKRGIEFKIRHCANSAAIMDHPETHLDMVRPGIILYGLYPSEEVHKERLPLKPAMTIKAEVIHVKTVPAGTHISYGCRHCASRPEIIATLPLGYADGYSRILSSSEVLIHGQRVPVVGRICMDQCMVDVSDVSEVKIGDEVVVFGNQGNETLKVEELATKLGTISYEVVCMMAHRVPRVYVNQ